MDIQLNDKLILSARNAGVVIGENCRLCKSIHWGSEPYLISIGNHCLISYGVDFITHDAGTWLFREEAEYKGIMNMARIIIKDNCYIGAHSTILPGVIIEENCIVGTKSVVTKSLKKNGVYAGNPAKYICSLEEYKNKCVINNAKYNKNYVKSEDKQTRIESLMEGYEEHKPFI